MDYMKKKRIEKIWTENVGGKLSEEDRKAILRWLEHAKRNTEEGDDSNKCTEDGALREKAQDRRKLNGQNHNRERG